MPPKRLTYNLETPSILINHNIVWINHNKKSMIDFFYNKIEKYIHTFYSLFNKSTFAIGNGSITPLAT